MEGVQRGVGRGASGRQGGLADDLPAEEPPLRTIGLADEPVVPNALHVEVPHKPLYGLFDDVLFAQRDLVPNT